MQFLGNIRIGKRLMLGFALILAFSVVITALGIWRLANVATATRTVMSKPLLKERLMGDWYANASAGVRRTIAIAKSSDPTLATYFAEDAAAASKSSTEYQQKVEALLSTEEEKVVFAKIGSLRNVYLSARDRIAKAKETGNADEASRVLDDVFVPGSSNYLAAMRELVEIQRGVIDKTAGDIESIATTSRTLLLILEGMILSLGVVCAYFLTVSITRPLTAAVEVSRRVAQGDLSATIEVASRDETGKLLQALKDMNGRLGATVTSIRGASESVAGAAAQIAAGNMDLSSRTEEQAASLEQTVASIADLTGTVRQSAENARQATSLAASAREMTESGRVDVAAVARTINEVNADSAKIAEITGMIEGIAFQTNILALNAAVEAARAGEQGRGFAVVASEVRSLAQRSSAAAKEVKQLIDASTEKIQDSAEQATGANAVMERVSIAIKRVSDIVGEISAASDEQSRNIEQINQAIEQIDQVTQQNAALVEQSAAAAQSLREQAAGLKDGMTFFKVGKLPASGLSLVV